MSAPRTGLREAHAHIAAHGRAMTMTRFEGCRSADEFLDVLASAAGRAGAGEWALGGGVRVEAWTDPRLPTLDRIDAVTGPRPACVWMFDYHGVIVNSAAMRAVGIAADMPDPPHGRIERDRAGRPTGLMLEAAAKLVWSRIPEPGPELRRRHVESALADLASHGFVEVHDLLSPPWLGPLLSELEREGRLPLESVWLYPPLAELPGAIAECPSWESPRVRIGGAKVFVDGTLNSRTALMLEPYADPLPGLPCGQAMMTRDELVAAFDTVYRCCGPFGHLAAHAIGDGAVRIVLDAVEQANPRLDEEGICVRIEHAEIIDAADVPRFDEMSVTLSVQPCHLLADIEALRRHVPHRLHRVLPLRELIDAGCRPLSRPHHLRILSNRAELWFGSDAPIVRPDPGDSIQAAVHRRRQGAPESDAIAPQQAITEAEAWAAFRPA